MSDYNFYDNEKPDHSIDIIEHKGFIEISVNGHDPVTIIPRESLVLYNNQRSSIYAPVFYYSYLLCSGKTGWSVLIPVKSEYDPVYNRESLKQAAEELGYYPVVLDYTRNQYIPETYNLFLTPDSSPMHMAITVGIYTE
jgi:hypothetical protein